MKRFVLLSMLSHVALSLTGVAEADDGIKSSDEIVKEMVGTRGFGVKARAFLDVKFEYDSARLTSQARAQLDQLAVALKSDELCHFTYELEGHTDSTGSEAYNQSLSEARAATAFVYLISAAGITKDRLESSGHGESRLLNPNHGEAAENRRVEVVEIGELDGDAAECSKREQQ